MWIGELGAYRAGTVWDRRCKVLTAWCCRCTRIRVRSIRRRCVVAVERLRCLSLHRLSVSSIISLIYSLNLSLHTLLSQSLNRPQTDLTPQSNLSKIVYLWCRLPYPTPAPLPQHFPNACLTMRHPRSISPMR